MLIVSGNLQSLQSFAEQLEVVSVADTFYQCMFDTVYASIIPINIFHKQRFGVSENRPVLAFFNSFDSDKGGPLHCMSLLEWLILIETYLILLYGRLEWPRAGLQ